MTEIPAVRPESTIRLDPGEPKQAKDKEATRQRIKKYLETQSIDSFSDALDAAGDRPLQTASREEKKNYAQYLSEAIAVLVANKLRPAFPEILPKSNGEGQESRARTGKGIKKLDVNYSTPQLGLGLGISIKTLNFKDGRSQRFTKNPTRLDNEFRAEAMDYHQRQPYAVLAGLIFVPFAACHDGKTDNPKTSRSSLAQIINVVRHRANRRLPTDDAQLFETIYVGLYEYEGADRGKTLFFDATDRPPQFGMPADDQLLSFEQTLNRIVSVYDRRNTVRPAWEPDPQDDKGMPVPMSSLIEKQALPPGPDEEDDEEDAS